MHFRTRNGRALGLARTSRRIGADGDAPAAVPCDVTGEVQVDRRIDTTGVKGRRAGAGLELPKCDLVVLIAVAA